VGLKLMKISQKKLIKIPYKIFQEILPNEVFDFQIIIKRFIRYKNKE
jgi:hypothetical protein